jgi:putative transposase
VDISTLNSALESIGSRDKIEARGKELGAFQRRTKVRTYDVILALLRAPCVERKRTIASVRRAWEALTGEAVAESTFEDHFKPGLVRLLWELLRDAMAPANRLARRRWPPELRRLRDILVCDGTRMALPDGLAGTYAGTSEGKAGVKILGLYSLGEGAMKDVRAGAAVHHDHRLLRLGALTRNALYLLDLGFYDHDQFVAYDKAHAFFVSRLKSNVVPIIDGEVHGVVDARHAQGKRLDDALRYHPEVDVDVRLRTGSTESGDHPFRVVKLDVARRDRHDHPLRERVACWYVTNLPREEWTVAMISALYLLRWAIERIWRQAKHLARMDQLQSKRPAVVFAFLLSSLLLWALGNRIAQEIEYERGLGKVSHDRVLAWVVSTMADITRDLSQRPDEINDYLRRRISALMREARHPNPSQPRRVTGVVGVLEAEMKYLPRAA